MRRPSARFIACRSEQPLLVLRRERQVRQALVIEHVVAPGLMDPVNCGGIAFGGKRYPHFLTLISIRPGRQIGRSLSFRIIITLILIPFLAHLSLAAIALSSQGISQHDSNHLKLFTC
jgi:hypothetical protein